MASGCGTLHRGKNPSSVTQLPILTALHAEIPTLFAAIIHDYSINVNPLFAEKARFCQNKNENLT